MQARRARSTVAAIAVAAVVATFVQVARGGTGGSDALQAIPAANPTSPATHAPSGRWPSVLLTPSPTTGEQGATPGALADAQPTRSTLSVLVVAPGQGLPTVGALDETPLEDTHLEFRPAHVPTEVVPGVTAPKGELLSLPISTGHSSSRFGVRFHPVLHRWKLHTGHDWAAPCGTAVGAAAPGTVVRTGYAGGNGVQVKIDHGMLAGHRVFTTYNHLSSIGVEVGQRVSTHQGVGRVGNTGLSTGCHLHFEVIADGSFTDPVPWLNGDPVIVDVSVMGSEVPQAPASPVGTQTATAMPTPSRPVPTPPPTRTVSATPSASPTATVPVGSPTASPTGSPTATSTATATVAPTGTTRPTASATATSSGPIDTTSPTATRTPTATQAPTSTKAPSPTKEPTSTKAPSPSTAPSPTGAPNTTTP